MGVFVSTKSFYILCEIGEGGIIHTSIDHVYDTDATWTDLSLTGLEGLTMLKHSMALQNMLYKFILFYGIKCVHLLFKILSSQKCKYKMCSGDVLMQHSSLGSQKKLATWCLWNEYFVRSRGSTTLPPSTSPRMQLKYWNTSSVSWT